MTTAYKVPGPLAFEDSAVRFGTPGEENSRGLFRKLVKATYTLIDGTNSGSTVDYVAEEISVSVASTTGLTDTQLRATPVPVSGTVTATGPLTDTQLRATAVPVSGTVATTAADGSNVAIGTTSDASSATTVIGRLQKLVALLPAALGVLGGLKVEVLPASTGTLTSPANSASSFTVLASNANRKGATIVNDDTAVTGATLYLKFGTTASATSYTVALAPQAYYEVPYGFTGRIDGLASAATGTARVTELT